MNVTRQDVASYLGPLGDEAADRILALGVTRADLEEVAHQIEMSAGDDDALDDETIVELCRLAVDDEEGEEVWADDE